MSETRYFKAPKEVCVKCHNNEYCKANPTSKIPEDCYLV